ncbi:hypothetical protein AWM68_02830 [Fictibacillus phosphorivorans]|uniref:Uncharacterized protein n=1 Tax=Fictibacillus phosphorivorans TaxID=1221500 RepID=A0A163SJ87_9BACL|nr:hypothetical protein AWM68_02830 [Fictibacillus phosphorivorans]
MYSQLFINGTKVKIFDFTQMIWEKADVVIGCVGMEGKKSPLEFVEQKLKLQGALLVLYRLRQKLYAM